MFSNPQEIINQLTIPEGGIVADLGAGSGFYTIAAARALGETGIVYAIEVQKDLLEKLKKEVREEGLKNIEALWANIEKINGTKLKSQSVDVVLLANILFQVEDKETTIEEVKRILKPDGVVAVVDWQDSYGGLGPQPEHMFDEKSAENLFLSAGFRSKEKLSNAGSHHYGLLFKYQE